MPTTAGGGAGGMNKAVAARNDDRRESEMSTSGLTSIFRAAFSTATGRHRKSVDFDHHKDDDELPSPARAAVELTTNCAAAPLLLPGVKRSSIQMNPPIAISRASRHTSGLLQRASSGGGGIPRPPAAKIGRYHHHQQKSSGAGETLLPHHVTTPPPTELVPPGGLGAAHGKKGTTGGGGGGGGGGGAQMSNTTNHKSGGAGGGSARLITPAEWRKLAVLAFGSFVNNCTYSLLAPFFPTVARERGVSDAHVGFIFGIFSLAAFITAPLAGILLQRKRFSRKNMMVFGMLVNAVFTAAFGLLEFFKRDEAAAMVLEPDEGGDEDADESSGRLLLIGYVSFAFLTRIFAGFGCGLTDTALYALIAATFKGHEQLPALMGTMESVCGLGFVAGPALGGVLYDATSFSATLFLPSALLGAYVLLPILLLHEPPTTKSMQQRKITGGGDVDGGVAGFIESGGMISPRPAPPHPKPSVTPQPSTVDCDTIGGGTSGSAAGGGGEEVVVEVKMRHLFRTFRFVSVCWSGVLANVQFGYLEATYAEHAEDPGSSTRVGFLFAIMAFTYCLLTSPVGSICVRWGLQTCLALGFIIESVGYVVLVPPESWGRAFLELPGREHVAMAINGLGAAFSSVPIYPALLKAAGGGGGGGGGGEEDRFEGVADLVAGVTGSSFQLGNFLGPVSAGLVVSATSTYHQAIMFVVVFFLVQAFVEARGLLFPFIKW